MLLNGVLAMFGWYWLFRRKASLLSLVEVGGKAAQTSLPLFEIQKPSLTSTKSELPLLDC